MNVISKAKSKTTKNRYSLLVRMKGSIFVTRKNEKQQQKKKKQRNKWGKNGCRVGQGGSVAFEKQRSRLMFLILCWPWTIKKDKINVCAVLAEQSIFFF